MMTELSPFRLMNILFLGLGISLLYCLFGLAFIWYFDGETDALRFFAAYTSSFKTIISLGIILGTALIVYRTQNIIPETIEAAFNGRLSDDYYYYKRRFGSLRISLTFSAEFIVVAFIIFTYCQFPLSKRGEVLMTIAACAEYGLAVYVGRKLMYTGMMLRSLLTIPITRNFFRKRELDAINPYIHVSSTLTIIFLYVHLMGYYEGPFLYGSKLGQSIKIFLILLPLIAAPVLLIFNFYPRVVLRDLYSKSIDIEIEKLKNAMQNETLSPSQKRSHLIEFNKMSRDELRYSLQLALTDLPIGITILIMVVQTLMKR